MAPRANREPTRAQLSSKLAYHSQKPAFLLKFQNRMNGIPDPEEDEDLREDEEFEDVGDGREPIPRRPRERPSIPERPEEDPGSADEDDGDEKPQVVVLKAGKHLTEREAENVRRKEKGLPPLPDPKTEVKKDDSDPKSKKGEARDGPKSTSNSKSGSQGLSFASSSKASFGKSNKRKATSQLEELVSEKSAKKDTKASSSKNSSKKAKKESKTLLSFGDDA